MKKTTTLIFSIILSSSLGAQFHDNHWMLGYFGGSDSSPTDSFGISILSFFNAELKIVNDQEIDLFFQEGNALSDYEGNLLMYSNNKEIRDANDQLVLNGYLELNGDPEQVLPQSFAFLPFNDNDIVHYVQMNYTNDFPRLGKDFSTSLISTSGTLELYETVGNIIPDSLAVGQLTACRHANGRDWWVLVAVANKPIVYSILVTPQNIMLANTIEVEFEMESGVGQAKFSPNGNHYIRYNNVRVGEEDYLDIFEFDRATGTLSNHQRTSVGTDARSGGIAISPSSQFLYVSHYNHVFQYDLWAANIFSTKDTVAIYDGFQELDFFSTRFYLSALAPDGKIYINSPTSVTKLHVIEHPDIKGLACDVRQHSVQLPNWNIATLANHPNYRLGPIDGSLADSLGIDNLPRAYFRTDRDTADSLNFHFQDLSFYEPEQWNWTFGDGAESTDRHPNHTYANTGIYEVCLTVSNDLGSDTRCRTIELGPSSLGETPSLKTKLFPNPVQDILVFDLGEYLPLSGQVKLFDSSGREVLTKRILYNQTRLDLRQLPEGTYFYSFWDGGLQLSKGKFIKSR